jgi:hypothetical protein
VAVVVEEKVEEEEEEEEEEGRRYARGDAATAAVADRKLSLSSPPTGPSPSPTTESG